MSISNDVGGSLRGLLGMSNGLVGDDMISFVGVAGGEDSASEEGNVLFLRSRGGRIGDDCGDCSGVLEK